MRKLEIAAYLIMGTAAVGVAATAGLARGLTWAGLGVALGQLIANRALTAENKTLAAENAVLVETVKRWFGEDDAMQPITALAAKNTALAAENKVLREMIGQDDSLLTIEIASRLEHATDDG